MQAPLPYMTQPTPTRWDVDLGHLKTLAICHYVWGGLTILMSCLAIFYIVLGVIALNDPSMFNPPAGSPAAAANQPQPPPEFFGWFFIGCGSVGLLLGWVTGTLTILAGRGLATQRRRTLSLVMAGLNCLSVPFGTLLGVFTFVILLRPSVQALYQQRAAERAAGSGAGAGAWGAAPRA